MNRRHFLAGAGGTVAAGRLAGSPGRHRSLSFCDCALQPQAAVPPGAGALASVGSKVRTIANFFFILFSLPFLILKTFFYFLTRFSPEK